MATTATFIPNPAGWHRLVDDPSGPAGQWVTRLLNRVVSYAKQYANVDTGNMRSRIEFSLSTGPSGLVGIVAAKTNYSLYVHEGTLYYEGNPFLTDAARTVLGT